MKALLEQASSGTRQYCGQLRLSQRREVAKKRFFDMIYMIDKMKRRTLNLVNPVHPV